MFVQLLLNILIVIVIVLIINNLLWIFDYLTSKNVQKTSYWMKFPEELKNLKVVSISCSKSKCTFWPTIQNVISHYDVICLCDDGNYYNISLYYPTDNSKQKIKDIDPKALEYKTWYRVDKVKVKDSNFNRKVFELHGYKYICKKFKKLKDQLKLSFIYQLVHDVTGIPWGLISHNCHAHAKEVCRIALDKKSLKYYVKHFNPKHFEQYISQFKPMLTLKEVISENIGINSIWNDYSQDI
jgi:hypothetical protein